MSMDARLRAILACCALTFFMGASARTTNFIVQAPTPDFAEQVASEAERFRKELAIHWLGEELPAWPQPCPIMVQVGENLGAGGATSFSFDRGEVFGWRMSIQGSAERILDSVLPHEVNHTIFATYFRQPLPRWADEGACTTVEHASERQKQQDMLIFFLQNERGISFSRMFAMKEYPRDVLPLYSQGYSLTRFLVHQGGPRKFVAFMGDGLKTENWSQALGDHYGYQNLGKLQDSWLSWVKDGSPLVDAETQIAGGSTASPEIRTVSATETVEPTSPTAGTGQRLAGVQPLVPIARPGSSDIAARGPQGASDFAASPATGTDPRRGVPPAAVAASQPVRGTDQGWVAVNPKYPRTPAASESVASRTSAPLPPLDRYRTPTSAGPIGGLPPSPSARTAAAASIPPQSTELARPQPVQSTQQTVLEWNRGEGAPTPARETLTAPRELTYDAPVSGTMRR